MKQHTTASSKQHKGGLFFVLLFMTTIMHLGCTTVGHIQSDGQDRLSVKGYTDADTPAEVNTWSFNIPSGSRLSYDAQGYVMIELSRDTPFRHFSATTGTPRVSIKDIRDADRADRRPLLVVAIIALIGGVASFFVPLPVGKLTVASAALSVSGAAFALWMFIGFVQANPVILWGLLGLIVIVGLVALGEFFGFWERAKLEKKKS